MKLIVLVPLYNEERNIDIVSKKLNESLRSYRNYKILFIDDGSVDKTWNKIDIISKKDKKICGIKLKKNIGKDKALMQGINFALRKNFDSILMIDGDLQHPVEQIDSLIKFHIKSNFSVIGRRTITKLSLIRRILSKIFFLFLSFFTFKKIKNNLTDFCLIKKIDAENYLKFDDKRFNCILFASYIKKIIFFDFKTVERIYGNSKFNFFSLLKLALKIYSKIIDWKNLIIYITIIIFSLKIFSSKTLFYFLNFFLAIFLFLILIKLIIKIRSKFIKLDKIIETLIFQ